MKELPQSTQTLIAALQEKNDSRLDLIIENARQNIYHDYLSYAWAPQHLLVDHLSKIGGDFKDLIDRVKNGDFDATQEESREWMKSEGAQDIFNMLTSNN